MIFSEKIVFHWAQFDRNWGFQNNKRDLKKHWSLNGTRKPKKLLKDF